MKLQIAVDIADTARIMEIGEKIHDVIDIYEVGTPVIMKEGLAPVRALKQKYPELTVLADSKIMDGGAPVVRIHKKWMSWGDAFELDIAPGTDEVLALAVVLAIDAVLDSQQAAATAN